MIASERTDPRVGEDKFSAVAAAPEEASRPEGGEDVSSLVPETAVPPPPTGSRSALIDWAYDEYLRLEEDKRPDPVSYCDRFPSCRSALRRLFQFHRFLGDRSDCLLVPRQEAEAIPWPEVGEKHGDLTLLRRLGCGTFACVFLASEESTGGRLVAVKYSKGGGAEARTLGRLAHPNVVPILSSRREESTGLTVVIMPYLGSATLEDVLDHVRDDPAARTSAAILDVVGACARPEDPPAGLAAPPLRKGSLADAVLHLAVRLTEALAFVHDSGFCHRDLKPSNVLLDPAGNPLLLDFNLSTGGLESVPGGGTLRYSPPEQLRGFLKNGETEVDGRADLFSLAVIVHELLTGEHPYGPVPTGLEPGALATYLLERLQGDISSFGRVAGLEKPVAAALDRCLSLDPSGRPRAAELAVELKRQFAPARQLRRWAAERPRRLLTALGLLVLAAVLAGHAWSTTPPYAEREYRRGEEAYRRGDYDAAEQHFDHAVRADPGNPRPRFARGCARLKQSKSRPDDPDKLQDAWADLNATPNRPLDAPLLAVKAYIDGRQQQPEKAIPIYKQLEEAGYRRVMVLNNRAYSYLQTGQFQEAQRDLEEASRSDPDCQAIRYNKARLALFKRLRDAQAVIPAQALKDIEQAIHLGPRTSALYRDAALLYAFAGHDEQIGLPPSERKEGISPRSRTAKQRLERALSCLREAIDGGEPPYILRNNILRSVLGSRAEFEDLNQRTPQHVLPRIEICLLAPVDLVD